MVSLTIGIFALLAFFALEVVLLLSLPLLGGSQVRPTVIEPVSIHMSAGIAENLLVEVRQLILAFDSLAGDDVAS